MLVHFARLSVISRDICHFRKLFGDNPQGTCVGVIEDYTEQIPPKRIIITENYPKSHNNTRTLGLYSFRAFSLLTVKFKKCMDIKQTNQK